jgi:hypothetical protein
VLGGDAELAARHAAVDLVHRRPDLWPMLNVLTLDRANPWVVVLAHLQAEAVRVVQLRA